MNYFYRIARNIFFNHMNNPLDLIYARLKYNTLLKLKYKEAQPLVKVNNYKMFVRKEDKGLSRQLILRGKREILATKYFLQDMEPGMTFLEVGANLGYYVLLELFNCKNCKIIALEPNPENYKVLKKNIIFHKQTKNVKLYPYAASDKPSQTEFYVPEHCNAGSLVKRKNTIKTFKVDAVKLDDLIKTKIDYVRMDVEGHEINVVKGMHKILKSKNGPKKLFIEVHPGSLRQRGSSINEFLDLILSYGYKFKKGIYQRSSIYAVGERVIGTYTDYKRFLKNPDFHYRAGICFFSK